MGEALIVRREGIPNIENLTWENSSYPSNLTVNTSGSYSKTSWACLAYLNETGYTNAVAHLVWRSQTTNVGCRLFGIGTELTGVLPWGAYYCHCVKIDTDSNGRIGLYIKSTDDAPWTGTNYGPTQSFYIIDVAIIPFS